MRENHTKVWGIILIITLTLALALTPTASAFRTLPSDNLRFSGAVLHLPFDINVSGNTLYDIAEKNNGAVDTYQTSSIQDGHNAWIAGQVGNALRFDGVNDYGKVLNSAVLSNMSNITLEAWVKPDSLGGNQRILDKWDDMYLWRFENNKLRIIFVNSTGGQTSVLSTTTFSDGVWYHIVAIYNGSEVRQYINGTEDATIGSLSGNLSSVRDLIIGANPSGEFFKGTIDQIYIYNRTLNDTEINWSYERGSAGLPSNVSSDGLVLYLPLNESSGITASDSSGNGNDGTLYNYKRPAYTSGKYGGAMKFDGVDDDVQVSATLPVATFTYSFWFLPAVNYTTRDDGYYGGIHIGYSSGKGVILSWEGWHDGWLLRDESHYASMTYTTTPMYVGNWYFITATFDGATAKIYINGVKEAESSYTDVPVSYGDNVIGTSSRGGFLNGTIDEVEVYNRALSPSEVYEEYLNGCGQLNRSATLNFTNELDSQDDNSVLYMRFDENSTTQTDYSRIGTNTGTVSGATYVSNGFAEGDYSFDGVDDYVDAGNDSSLSTDYVTVSAWIKTNDISVTTAPITKGTGNGDVSWEVYQSNDAISFYINNGTDLARATATTKLTVGNWIYVVGTYDGSNIKIYINGVLERTTAISGTLKQTTYDVLIGKRTDGYYFNGTIDEVKIYNRSLSASEIKQMYERGKRIFYSGGTCWTVNNNSITLDGNGFTIIGNTTGEGVYDYNYDNNIFQNLEISNFSAGINLQYYTTNTTIERNTIHDNTDGIYLDSSSSNIINNNTLYNDSSADIHFNYKTDYNNITNNNIPDGGYYGIYFNYGRHNLIQNNDIEGAVYDIYLYNGANYNNISNNILKVPAGHDNIRLYSSSYNNVDNNAMTQDGTGACVWDTVNANYNTFNNDTFKKTGAGTYLFGFWSSRGIIVNNSIFNSTGTSTYVIINTQTNNSILNSEIYSTTSKPIYVYGTSTQGLQVNDTIINSTADYDIYFDANTIGTINFTNTTFRKDKVYFDATSNATLWVKWYLDTYVNDTFGLPVPDVNVTGKDVYNTTVLSELTGSNGYISRYTLPEYWQNVTTTYYFTNYTLTANKSTFNVTSKQVNLTESMSVFLTLEREPINEDVALGGVLILLAIISILLFFAGSLDEEHKALKLLYLLSGFAFGLLLVNFGISLTEMYQPSLYNLLSTSYHAFLIVTIFVLFYFIIYFIYKTVLSIKVRRVG